MALAVGGSKVRVGGSRVWGEQVYRAEPQRERDGGGSFLDTTDNSLGHQHRTAFCALNYKHISYKPAVYMDRGLSFDACSGVFGEEGFLLTKKEGRAREQVGTSSFGSVSWRNPRRRRRVCVASE